MREEQPQEAAPEISAEDIEGLKRTLLEEKAKAEKYLANWQRSEADLINHRRRTEQQTEELKITANAGLMLDLIVFLDDLERAFAAIHPELEHEPWVEGIQMVKHKLDLILEKQGLKAIPAVGERFDPRFHEAVAQGKGEEGIIVEEVHKGYTFRDRVIRASKVIVGMGNQQSPDSL